MPDIIDKYNLFLGYLLLGDSKMLDSAIYHLKPEYFIEPFFTDVVGAIYTLLQLDQNINGWSVCESLASEQQIEHARSFLRLPQTENIKKVKRAIVDFFVECMTLTGSGAEFDSLIRFILEDYIRAQNQRELKEYLDNIRNPLALDTYISRVQATSSLIDNQSWKTSILDLSTLRGMSIPGSLIQKNDEGLIYRNDVHMISGAPGTMKSTLAMCIVAAALNDGLNARYTLGMYATVQGLRVAYVDTELGTDTIQRRLPFWEAACGNIVFDQNRFGYYSLRRFQKSERLRRTCSIIRDGDYDLVIVDGLRDIAVDFNDAREASDLADTFKRLAEDSQSAIIVTSHTSKGTDYSRGHLGSQFADEVGLDIKLRKRTTDEHIIDVVMNKSRHSLPRNFSFVHKEKMLIEVESTIDTSSGLSKSQKTALELFKKYLVPGKKYRHNEIIKILGEQGVIESTAKKYLKEAVGYTLRHEDRDYILPEVSLLDGEDMPSA